MIEANIGLAAKRLNNTLPEIEARFRNGEALNAGNVAKVLHLIEDHSKKDQLRLKILETQGAYWRDWWEFRCLPAGEGKPNFDDIVRLLPVRREFANFVNLQDDTLVVDLMAGSANMAPYFQETGKLAGYVGIDSNNLIEGIARRRLSKLGIKNAGFILHDLSEGLPEPELFSNTSEVNSKTVQYASMWGISYLDAERFTDLVDQCLRLNVGRGVDPKLSFCMITDGSFDPQVLRKRFMKEIFPRELSRLHFKPLIRAIKAIPQMMEFGKTFREVSPVWYPEEIIGLLDKAGVQVDRVDDTLLWGQSTAIKVSNFKK
ncbi:class I SAM-dependent methyltransferase [Patescibacteria group bacterium]|nr:class I SAM-dependent methyltransferase [Patescibacteria group bacterium]